MNGRVKLSVIGLVLSLSGLAFIGGHEGTVHEAYLDPVGIPTICTGHTGPEVKLGQRVSKEFCADLLKKDTAYAQKAVKRLVKTPVTQTQFDALVSFTFNVGEGNLASSTLLRKINAGDCWGAANEFPRWNKAKGRVLRGLTERRLDEQSMWASGC